MKDVIRKNTETQIKEGWKVYKTSYNYREKFKECTSFILNNETYELEPQDCGREEIVE